MLAALSQIAEIEALCSRGSEAACGVRDRTYRNFPGRLHLRSQSAEGQGETIPGRPQHGGSALISGRSRRVPLRDARGQDLTHSEWARHVSSWKREPTFDRGPLRDCVPREAGLFSVGRTGFNARARCLPVIICRRTSPTIFNAVSWLYDCKLVRGRVFLTSLSQDGWLPMNPCQPSR